MIKEWYKTHLGFNMESFGTMFEWPQDKGGYTLWSPFPADTDYFEPSEKEFMINFRVENIESFVEELKKEKVTVLDDIQSYEYGKFVHILDPEGNKIELWEP
jgi:predicted enzyme related to lactoylglutathione lyase